MSLTAQDRVLHDRFLQVFLDTSIALQPGDDLEITLEALIEASQSLTLHLQHQLHDLRVEQAD